MYSRSQLAKKYIHYYLTASNGKGHGVHSPFVFDFIKNVLNDKKDYDRYHSIEKLRGELLQDRRSIEVEDFGAGSLAVPHRQKKISDITRSFLKTKKFAQLLFRIVQYYKPATIVELGTSLGITTAYIACAHKASEVFTLEGSKNVAAIAEDNFEKLGLQNVKVVKGNFDDTLPGLLSEIEKIDLVFVDGNHRKVPTLHYFQKFLQKSNDQSVFIFDDIHWSAEMEAAWKEIQQHPSVTLTIDLFFIGLVFFKKDIKAKQHFVIRF
ncbi:MAG TPA: class I SAM-dependent methyltransferase [Chitinophagaceae bacterium]|nr:class I SAM-dependent methyltransferase [Chitinophagaceae bacterium]